MIKYLFLLSLLALLFSCSAPTKLSHKYEGKGVELLYKEMGSPKNIFEMDNGNRLFEYEKETFIKETEIGTGRGTLDKRISPSFIKVEMYRFEIDKKGIIVRSAYQKRIDQ